MSTQPLLQTVPGSFFFHHANCASKNSRRNTAAQCNAMHRPRLTTNITQAKESPSPLASSPKSSSPTNEHSSHGSTSPSSSAASPSASSTSVIASAASPPGFSLSSPWQPWFTHYSLSTGGPRVYGNVDRVVSTTDSVLRCLRSHCWLLLLSTLYSEFVRRIRLDRWTLIWTIYIECECECECV